MQRVLAICFLTLRAAFRYRLVLVLAAILICGVTILPLVIKHDGSARGFTQILVTYTLSLTTLMLGFATIWLACGTLAREIEEAQIQMIAVKPIARWQIWMGKWLGIMALNAILLTVAGSAVYVGMLWKSRNLSEKEKTVLRDEVLISRASAREPIPDYKGDAERILRKRIKDVPPPEGTDPAMLRQMVTERVKAEYQIVRPGFVREWTIKLGNPGSLAGKPLYIRTKFNSAQSGEGKTFPTAWEIGVPASAKLYRTNLVMVPDTFSEFRVPPNLYDDQGIAHIRFFNLTETALLFPLEEGMEVMFREGGFGLNFIRGLMIILFWLGLLAALGLAASSFLSFPVAAFCTIGALVVTFSTWTLRQIVDEGGITGVNNNTGLVDTPKLLDQAAVGLSRGILGLLDMARGFSPIDNLSSGRSISWTEIARAFFQIIIVMSGLVAAFGMFIFSRRELATAQGKT